MEYLLSAQSIVTVELPALNDCTWLCDCRSLSFYLKVQVIQEGLVSMIRNAEPYHSYTVISFEPVSLFGHCNQCS